MTGVSCKDGNGVEAAGDCAGGAWGERRLGNNSIYNRQAICTGYASYLYNVT